MKDLATSDVQDGGVIFSPVEDGDVFEELSTKTILRAEDWEFDDDGRKAWEMSFFVVLDEASWAPKAGYVYESELSDHFKYKLLYKKRYPGVMWPTVVKFPVPIKFDRHGWQHGSSVWVNVARAGIGTVTVQAIGEDLSDVHVSLSCLNTQRTALDERVGRFLYVKNYTFVTLDAKGEPVNVEATVLISGKI